MFRFIYLRIVDDAGAETSTIAPVSLWSLASTAAEEFLQGSPMATAFVSLFDTHLDAGPLLRWRGAMAESTEMRRALSGLYGRIVARTLLRDWRGMAHFKALERNETAYAFLKVSRDRDTAGKYLGGDIPDWIALDTMARRVALGEAKGSISGNPSEFGQGVPACINDGKAQFGRVTVTSGSMPVGTINWVAANLWSTERRTHWPVGLLWDPPADGEQIPPDRWFELERGARADWLGTLLPAFGMSADRDPVKSLAAGFGVMVDVPAGERDDAVATLRTLASLGSGLDRSPAIDLTVQQDVSTEPHRGRYVLGLLTKWGMAPIRSPEELTSAQDRLKFEHREGRSALMVGIATDAGTRTFGDGARNPWFAANGLVRADGFAIFAAEKVVLSFDPGDAGGVAYTQ